MIPPAAAMGCLTLPIVDKKIAAVACRHPVGDCGAGRRRDRTDRYARHPRHAYACLHLSAARTSYVESMHADAHRFASGVTTTVDAGTAGWRNFSDFKAQLH